MSLRIFVVDHGCLAAEGVTGLLRFMGHQVHTVSRLVTMLNEALCFRPDLALIDWTIPAAVPLCRELALSGARLIAVASPHEGGCFDIARKAGVVDFLTTPCDRSKLSRFLARVEDDVFACRDEAKFGHTGLDVPGALCRRHWEALAETTVFRLFGGIRDGQELFGDRAAHLYTMLGEDPLHRTFLACRSRPILMRQRIGRLVERHEYFVEEVRKSGEQTLVIARSLGAYD